MDLITVDIWTQTGIAKTVHILPMKMQGDTRCPLNSLRQIHVFQRTVEEYLWEFWSFFQLAVSEYLNSKHECTEVSQKLGLVLPFPGQRIRSGMQLHRDYAKHHNVCWLYGVGIVTWRWPNKTVLTVLSLWDGLFQISLQTPPIVETAGQMAAYQDLATLSEMCS